MSLKQSPSVKYLVRTQTSDEPYVETAIVCTSKQKVAAAKRVLAAKTVNGDVDVQSVPVDEPLFTLRFIPSEKAPSFFRNWRMEGQTRQEILQELKGKSGLEEARVAGIVPLFTAAGIPKTLGGKFYVEAVPFVG